MNETNPTGRWAEPAGYREVLRVAYPLIISMGSFTMMQFCDRMFLAWYSAISIQAGLPAGILSFTVICGFMALAGYANTFVAQYHGAGDKRGCSAATAQGVFLALASWPLMLLLMPAGQWVLRVSGHAPAVLREELTYFNILMIGSVTAPLGAAISSFFTGRGDTRANK
jgi:multidrug resistance protein, MATE family